MDLLKVDQETRVVLRALHKTQFAMQPGMSWKSYCRMLECWLEFYSNTTP